MAEALRTIIFYGLIVIITAAPAYGQNYELYGDVSLDTSYGFRTNQSPANSLAAEVTVEANHRFNFKNMEFFAHHSLALNHLGEFDHTLYEAYLYVHPANIFTMSLGKQHITWGTANLNKITDKLHPQAGLFDQQTGFPGMALTFTFTPDIVLTSALSLEDVLDDPDKDFARDLRPALYFDVLAGRFEFFTSCVYEADQILSPGLGFSVDMAGVILTGEAVFNLDNKTLYPINSSPVTPADWREPAFGRRFFGLDVGLQKTFNGDNFSFSLMGEYFFQDWGYKKDETEKFYRYLLPSLVSSAGDAEGAGLFGRHYLFAELDASFPDYLNFSNSVLINLLEGSVWVHHQLSIVYFERIDLNFKTEWVLGEKNKTEFGSYPEKVIVTLESVIHF